MVAIVWKRRILTLPGFVLLVGVTLVVGTSTVQLHHASMVAEESAQRALLDEAFQLLEAYHREHGRYPDSLKALTFTYPDGGDRTTLELLRYKSDGDHYSIATIGVSSGSELRISR